MLFVLHTENVVRMFLFQYSLYNVVFVALRGRVPDISQDQGSLSKCLFAKGHLAREFHVRFQRPPVFC